MQLSMANSLLKDLVHSLLSFVSHPPGLASLLFICPQHRDRTPHGTRSTLPAPAAFLALLSDQQEDEPGRLDHDAQYWWTSSGFALAILLDRAGYSGDAQRRLLQFIRAVVPSLGAAPGGPGGQPRWRSFMTDDHTPIELSWDWRTGGAGQTPKIRFSIEPVGVDAGTPADPYNQLAAARLRDVMRERLSPPRTDTETAWLAHFQRQLGSEEAAPAGRVGAVEGHLSREFYAFDLNDDGSVMSKAYFFPGFRARATRRSNFQVIREAIETAPGSTCAAEGDEKQLEALRVFEAYVGDAEHASSHGPLEMDMLAIDLVDPAASRFKIYFRVRDDTSFASVRRAMSLGGRVETPELRRGLDDLRRLYYALLGSSQTSSTLADDDDTQQLPARDHRTAGILYNVEFRYGSKRPKVKAYLPVRHYAQSEDAIISALEDYFSTKHLDNDSDNDSNDIDSSSSSPGWKTHMANYKEAVNTIL